MHEGRPERSQNQASRVASCKVLDNASPGLVYILGSMLIPKTKQYCLQLSCSFSLKICPRTAKRHFQKKKEEEPADKDEKDEKDKDKGNKEKKNK